MTIVTTTAEYRWQQKFPTKEVFDAFIAELHANAAAIPRDWQQQFNAEYWHTTYLITNDCGLYYIGKHSCKRTSQIRKPYLWPVFDHYYGSGKNLKRAQQIIKSGWQRPIVTGWYSNGHLAHNQETLDIKSAKDDELCLNHFFDPIRWTFQ